jgi:ribonuclease BN (tRNA processing enzyme)
MQLTVLGSAASYAGPGQACSGYLVEGEGTTLMLDCGNGTVANASEVTDVTSLDAVFISHTHADHILDLYALQAALRFAPEGPVGSLPLHLPEGLWERMKALLPPSGQAHLAEAFEPHVIEPGRALIFGELTVTPMPVDHDGPSFGFVVEEAGSRLAYTGDTSDGDAARAVAAGCDVLVAECTLPAEYAGRAPHLAPAEAGRLAKESGAGLLVLTHLWPTADHERMRTEAAAVFGGDVVLASELMTIEIEPAHSAPHAKGRTR